MATEIDSTVVKALKKLKELQYEVSRLEAFVSTYEELHGRKLDRDELLSGGGSHSTHRSRRRNNVSKLLDLSERLIREAGRPLTRGELADAMERENVTVHATDVPKYLGTLLWRNKDRFEAVDEGYTVAANETTTSDQRAMKVGDQEVEYDAAAKPEWTVDDDDIPF